MFIHPIALGRATICLLLCLALWACAPRPQPATPALWEVSAPGGQRGWLFGTIHALPAPLDWRRPPITAALKDAGELIVEIAALNDRAAMTQTFQTLSYQAGQPPVAMRVPPAQRPALAALMARGGLSDRDFATQKTWAVALTLASLNESDSAANGIDQALLAGAHPPVIELEGARSQLALFDALPEASQRVLLSEAVADAPHADADTRRLAQAWAHGDMKAIEREADAGLATDPTLRKTLFTDRNRRWAPLIARDILAGKRPFVAVGAAHMTGAEGLPALLTAAGFQVKRVE